MAKFPKYNFERRITDHRIPFARYHHGNFSMFTPGYMKANVQFALRQLWGGYQFFIMCGMLGFFSSSLPLMQLS